MSKVTIYAIQYMLFQSYFTSNTFFSLLINQVLCTRHYFYCLNYSHCNTGGWAQRSHPLIWINNKNTTRRTWWSWHSFYTHITGNTDHGRLVKWDHASPQPEAHYKGSQKKGGTCTSCTRFHVALSCVTHQCVHTERKGWEAVPEQETYPLIERKPHIVPWYNTHSFWSGASVQPPITGRGHPGLELSHSHEEYK